MIFSHNKRHEGSKPAPSAKRHTHPQHAQHYLALKPEELDNCNAPHLSLDDASLGAFAVDFDTAFFAWPLEEDFAFPIS